jgi:catechol 2,3-dioxygenase-like lactoylglutathione lyase family enzyme
MKNQLSHFCIHIKNMDKAIAFYRDKLGFEMEHQTNEWSELKLNDKISLALYKTNKLGSGIGFMVNNCEEATKQLEKNKVKIITRCDRRENDGIILTQFEDADENIIWMSEKI